MITYKTPEDFKKMEAAGKVVSNIHYEIYDKTKAAFLPRFLLSILHIPQMLRP